MKTKKLSVESEELRLLLINSIYDVLFEVQYAPAGQRDKVRRDYAMMIADGIYDAMATRYDMKLEKKRLWPPSLFIKGLKK